MSKKHVRSKSLGAIVEEEFDDDDFLFDVKEDESGDEEEQIEPPKITAPEMKQRVFIFPKDIVDSINGNDVDKGIVCQFPHPKNGFSTKIKFNSLFVC